MAPVVGLVVSAVWILAWQINNVKSKMYDKMDEVKTSILNKLEYHERHDDQRFAQINNDLWSVRLALARNGKETKTESTLRRETESQGIS